ncbi:MAG TPA: hypothetical protein EYG03_29045 [Planctomycetes bacterium]|nr:hypothetical protein [Fuerstiella sp.]HIK96010.1 hypothetical protein [Planctomycetota bacterium]
MPRDDADAVAEKLLSQLFRRSLEDGVITAQERARLNRLARRLEISKSGRESVFRRTGALELKKKVKNSADDGVVTREESAEIAQLRQTLGLGVAMTATVDGSHLKKTHKYQRTAPASAVLADLDAIRNIDGDAEHQVRFWTRILWLGMLALVGGLGLFVVNLDLVGGVVDVAGLVGGGVGVVGLATIVFAVIRRFLHGQLDVDDRRYELAAGILTYLSRDMAADEQVSVEIDFRPHNHKSKFVEKGKVGYWNAKFYVDPWIILKGRFLDGTKYAVSMIEKQQDRHRTKRSASGKLKTKTKTKNASEAIVTLKVKQKRYPELSAHASTVDASSVRLPGWVSVKTVGVEEEGLTLRSTTKLGWDVYSPGEREQEHDGVHWIAMKFMYLYSLLNQAKKAKHK